VKFTPGRNSVGNKSIKRRVILQVTGLIALAMLFVIVMVTLLVHQQMGSQMERLLENQASATQQRMEQRIRYLVENTLLLTRNDLTVNALIDADGRKTYLPPLVRNFREGKDVVSLSVVDFDGRPIFQTQEQIPRYDESAMLRAALAMGQVKLYVQPGDRQMVVVAPIEYYATTQGAVVVVFDMPAFARRSLPNDERASMRLLSGERAVFAYDPSPGEHYRTFSLDPDEKTPYLLQLGLRLEIGLPEAVYMAPVRDALVRLVGIGLLMVAAGVFVSFLLADAITRPILELYRRVRSAEGEGGVSCSPLGTGDELEALALAFDERSLSLQYQAEHDALTGLPNRMLFMDRVAHAIQHARREEKVMALLFIDLDRFKEINDSLGHAVGDRMLQRVAEILHETVRESDTVARLGGDEFTILLEEMRDENVATETIWKIMQRFQSEVAVDDYRFYVSCSIGVALYPVNGDNPEALLRNADSAMYKAKAEGRNTYQFYTDDMTSRAFERMTIQTQLRQAIDKEELRVYYQPQVNMRSGRIIGMEALVRWEHPERGMVAPDRFIPVAEETGLIIDIDRWMMRSAMTEFAAWIAQGREPGVLSLNLSMVQLKRSDFLMAVGHALDASGLPPSRLAFEITETQIMKDPDQTIATLHELKAMGISLSVDDFGTGQSSLAYLKRLPVDKIKIDQSFVRDIPDDADDVALTRTIIAMAQHLNLDLIAEGVETQVQSEFLLEFGCLEAQGYRYYRPMPGREVVTHI